jgi:ABC-2 type transport system ATP-binding protein
MARIQAEHLSVTFRAPVREAGLRAALGSLVRRRYRAVEAVRDVSFELQPGELVGFIGPNGAGKSTMLKVLAGVLHPTAGSASVLGFTPWQRDQRFLRQIALVRGSRPLAVPPELTVLDALRFQQLIYAVPEQQFRRNLAELVELLSLDPLLERQARGLSLGEKMRAGLAWSLIYRPAVLFLDEPTIGLDVGVVTVIRRFIADYCRQTGATVLLTSHAMADVEQLCRRVILIDHGRLVFDGKLAVLSERLAPHKLVSLTLAGVPAANLASFGEVVEHDGALVRLSVPRGDVAALTARLLAALPITDLTVAEPALEQVIGTAYGGRARESLPSKE